MSAPTIVGNFRCSCCCNGDRREYTDEDCEAGYMRCLGCNCIRARMGSATQITLRVQVAGALTIDSVERAAELARALGAADDLAMLGDGVLHYFEVSGQGAVNALEIAKLRRRENHHHRS